MIIREKYLRLGEQRILVKVSFKINSDDGYVESDIAEEIITEYLDEVISYVFRDLYKYYGIVKHDDIDYKDHLIRFDYEITTGEGTVAFDFPLYISDEATDEDGLPLMYDEVGLEIAFSQWIDYDGAIYYGDDTYYLQFLGVRVIPDFN